MRAIAYDRYGPPDVLHVVDVERPVPESDELLVRIHATTVNQTDCHMRRARPLLWRFMLGLRRPKRRILGFEFAGDVEAVAPPSRTSMWATACLACGAAPMPSTSA